VNIPVCSCLWSTQIRPTHMCEGVSPRSPLHLLPIHSLSQRRTSTTRGCTCHCCTFTREENSLLHVRLTALWRRTLDSAASTATGYKLHSAGVGSNPLRDEILVSMSPRPILSQPRDSFHLGVKQPKHKADHWPPTSPKIRKSGAVPPLPNSSSSCSV
jgi:hypothetical protein